MNKKIYFILVLTIFALMSVIVLSAPQVDEIYKKRRNENFEYIANISQVRKVIIYIELIDQSWATINLESLNFANETIPIIDSYMVNEYIKGEDWIYFDISFKVEREIQANIIEVTLELYSPLGGVYYYEIL